MIALKFSELSVKMNVFDTNSTKLIIDEILNWVTNLDALSSNHESEVEANC